MNKVELEAIKTDSTVSAMRIAFFRIIKLIIFVAVVAVLATVAMAYLGKPFDMMGIVALIGILSTVAFGGKAIQSFSENPATEKVSELINKFMPNKKEDSSNK